MTCSGIPSFQGPFTKEAAVDFTSKAVDKYGKLKDLSDVDSLLVLLKDFFNLFYIFEHYRKEMCEVLMRNNYFPITSTIVGNLFKSEYYSDERIWPCTYYTYGILWNFSDLNQEVAASIIDTEIPKVLVANVVSRPYINNLNVYNIRNLVLASLTIIHNTARFPGYQGPFNSKDLKMTLVELVRKDDSGDLGLISMLTLAVLVDETELHLLDEGKKAISSLIEYIKTAQSEREKRVDGFMTWELINGLRCISANDNMKKAIVDEGGIQVLIDVLQHPASDKDLEKCLATIWNLCFNKEIKKDLETVYNIKGVIKPFENHQSVEIKRIHEGIIWLLDKQSQRVKTASSARSRSSQVQREWKFDVFLSYSWDNKKIVLKIKNELVKSGIRVWIDVDQMKESILDGVAEGIETSRIFVMSVSEEYRTSPNCRLEAEYAVSLKKPIVPLIMEYKYKPTSWLGLIMGTKIYYRFNEGSDFQENFGNLSKNIKHMLTKRDQIDSSTKSIINGSGVDNWTKEDVRKWIRESQVNISKRKLSDIDGPLLASLLEMNLRAPEFLCETLKTEFEMDLVDILRFNEALKKL